MKKLLVLMAMVLGVVSIVRADVTVQTKILDANSQPPIVGGMIDGYSDGSVLKKGIIVSNNAGNIDYDASKVLTSPRLYEDKTNSEATNNGYTNKDYRIIDCTGIGKEQFWCTLKLLEGNTKYYIRAFAIQKDGAVVYGETLELVTQNYSRYNDSFDRANVWHAFDSTLFDLVTDEIIDPNDGFYYSTNENPTKVRHQVGTGYNTCYKYLTEWNYKLWYYHSAHCNQDKIVNTPVMTISDNKLFIEKNPLDADKDISIYYSINGNYFRPENYTDVYTAPIEITEPSTVYCYAISSDGYISYTNIYVVGDNTVENEFGEVADAVDLGLSVKWASWNVGADKPEGLGNLYAWGELSPKTDYSASTYKFYSDGYTKYGSVDNKYQLDSEDDVARQTWGDKWRIPTIEELKELSEKCTFTKTELNGVPVTKVTGPNGNFIYFPYPGNFTDKYLYYKNSIGSYWSSNLRSDSYAEDLDFISGMPSLNGDSRYHGQSIRPIYEDNNEVPLPNDNGTVPDVVDLGLTSGTLWAAWNIGASAPEEYGSYYAWGETTPKSNYAWSTYKFGNGANFSKYNSTDGLTELELEDDAAYVILGKDWRMPTHKEELELVNECSWESVTVNGISGYKITGPNGNSIFMPRGGLYDGTDYDCDGTKLSKVNTCGWYWSSTLNTIGSAYAQGLCFFPSLLTNVGDHERCDGHNIRPVYVGEVNSKISIVTKILDANSQPSIVGGMIDGYSDGSVLKKGIIVSTNAGNIDYDASKVLTSPRLYEDKTNSEATNNGYTNKDYRIIDCTGIGKEQFWCTLKLLEGNTKYYIRAFAIQKDGAVVYGETLELVTQNYSRYNDSFDRANVWHAFDSTLFDLVTDEIIDPNDGFYYSTNENPTKVRHQVGTGYNTCYKYLTEWNYKLWYYHSAHCNQDKIVNTPVMTISDNKLFIEKNPLDADKDISIYYSINGNYFRPENYTDVYTAPIEITEPSTVYCYAISSDGYISYTNIYVVGDNTVENEFGEVADAVDLGLSVKWASWNVGADKPEGLGNLYAWGELSPKTDYSASTYKFYSDGYTKYGSVDNKYQLDSEDDVARQTWGDKWRIPTIEELKELSEKCTFTKTELNGVPVTKVTGPNGNFIYFPYPGNFTDKYLYYKNSIGSYWSSNLRSDSYAEDLDFISGMPSLNGDSRYHGQSIRPVYAEATSIPPIAKDIETKGEMYNLHGQRIDKPSKGIYIKNGKKIIIR